MREETWAILERMASAEDFSDAAKALIDWACEFTGCDAAMLRFKEGDSDDGAWIPALFVRGFDGRFLRDETLVGAEECFCGSVCGARVQTQMPFYTEGGTFSWGRAQSITRDFSAQSLGEVRGRCMLEGYESMAILPLGGDSSSAEPVGCLYLADRERDKFSAHIETLEAVCTEAGPLLARFPSESRARALIHAIESALAPMAVPRVAGLDLSVSLTSATETAHLGGDFYDVIELGEGQVLLLVGDYCGKGIAAAGMASQARRVIAGLAREDQTPAQLLAEAEGVLRDLLPDGKFVTLAVCRYSPGGKLECALAGHPFPLALQEEGGVSELPLPTNLPLGCVLGTKAFREGEVTLQEHQTLILYTDGVTEARRDGRLFGVEGIAEVWRSLGRSSLDELTAGLCSTSAEFHAPELPPDDRLVLAARPAPPEE